ncbi:MAG: hypothetical protein GVY11_04395 [Gammaproteobacteria bacterium]|nr:hypothetical protein [Gammaproteobacteria bacterium]
MCTTCKPYAESLPLEVVCPLCGAQMSECRPEPDATQPIHQALRNAAGPPGLAIAAALATLAAIGFSSIPGLLLTLPLGVLLLALMIALMQRSGEGRTNAPATAGRADIEQIEYCLRMLPLGLPFAAVLMLGAVSGSLLLLTGAAVVTAALLPLSIMAAVCSETPRAGVDPREMARVGRITRKHYLPTAAASALGGAAIVALAHHAAASNPLWQAALAFAVAIAVLATSSYLGTVLRMHRRLLDYPAGVAPIDRPRRPDPDDYEPAMLAADAEVLLREKRTREARLLLGRALTRFPDDARLNEQFDALVAATARPRELRNHLERRLQRLFSSGSVEAATAMWQRYSPQLDDWVPRVSETRYRLALELDEMGDHQTAFRLLIGLPPDDSRFRHTAEAWLEAARILEEKLDQTDRAAELRKVVRQRYPDKARAWDKRWLTAASSTVKPQSRRAVQAAGG